MNNEQQSNEDELNRWLESDEADLIRKTLMSEHSQAGKAPHEDAIADKLIQSTIETNTTQAELKTRIRRWQIATTLATAACVILALSLITQRFTEPQLVSQPSPPTTQPLEKNALLRKDRTSASSIRPKLAETKKRLATLTNRSQSRRNRNFTL